MEGLKSTLSCFLLSFMYVFWVLSLTFEDFLNSGDSWPSFLKSKTLKSAGKFCADEQCFGLMGFRAKKKSKLIYFFGILQMLIFWRTLPVDQAGSPGKNPLASCLRFNICSCWWMGTHWKLDNCIICLFN